MSLQNQDVDSSPSSQIYFGKLSLQGHESGAKFKMNFSKLRKEEKMTATNWKRETAGGGGTKPFHVRGDQKVTDPSKTDLKYYTKMRKFYYF